MINPNHFDLQTLRIFLLAAEAGSLTAAAERAHVTLSSASKRIAELERGIDCTLFVRHARGLELTAAGQGLLGHARRVLEEVNRMAGELADFAVGVRGHVRLCANTSAIVQFLPNDLARFIQANPEVKIGMEEALSETIVEALESGRADLGIFADNVHSEHLHKVPYREDRLVLLVPAGHPLAEAKTLSFVETLQYDYVALNPGSSLLQRLSAAAMGTGSILRIRIQVSSFDGICRMIEAGLGIGILPRTAVRDELLGAGLHAVSLSDGWARRTLYLGARALEGLSPEARRLYNYLATAAV